jgi:hypothetical protein
MVPPPSLSAMFKTSLQKNNWSFINVYMKFYFAAVHKEFFLHNCKLVDSCEINYTSVYDSKEFVFRVACFPAGNLELINRVNSVRIFSIKQKCAPN